VLRVTTVVLERLPSVFADGAQHQALLKLLQLLAEPSAYASASLMDQLLQALCGMSRLLAVRDVGLLLDLHAGLVELAMGACFVCMRLHAVA